jgi:phosphonate transport system permease protein
VTAPIGAVRQGRQIRPQKPRPGLWGLGLGAVAIAMTVATAWDWEYGTGFSPLEVFRKLGNENDALAAIPHAKLGEFKSERSLNAFIETLRLAIVASIAGVIVARPIAMWSTPFGAPNRAARFVTKTLSNIIRSFPDVLWALLFVAAVGVGVLPGLLALFFFNIAVITKLTADTLDGIDMGPLEAADASGASRGQMLRTAVVPQILPAYASYSLYAFELNLRASVVLGFVGAGGIGQRIQFFQSQFAYEKMWGLVAMFIVVVFVVDRASTYLRRRLV